jgi:hypothetical protein
MPSYIEAYPLSCNVTVGTIRTRETRLRESGERKKRHEECCENPVAACRYLPGGLVSEAISYRAASTERSG